MRGNGNGRLDPISKLRSFKPTYYPNREAWYRIEDKDCISVTTVLDQGIAKNRFLMDWIMKTPNAEQIRNEAAQRGTMVHDAADAIDAGETLKRSNYPVDAWKLIEGYINYLKEYSPHLEASEVVVYDLQERVAGRIDRLFQIDGKRHLVDLKTNRGGIYPNAKVQSQEYGHLLSDGMGIPVDQIDILHLNKTKKGFTMHSEEPDPEYHTEVFQPAMKISLFNREFRDHPPEMEKLPDVLQKPTKVNGQPHLSR